MPRAESGGVWNLAGNIVDNVIFLWKKEKGTEKSREEKREERRGKRGPERRKTKRKRRECKKTKLN